MGYYACGSGDIFFQRRLRESELAGVRKILEEVGFEYDMPSSDPLRYKNRNAMESTPTEIGIWFSDGHYHTENYEEALNMIAEKYPVEAGYVECSGEDRCFWRFLYLGDGRWTEQNGHIEYDD